MQAFVTFLSHKLIGPYKFESSLRDSRVSVPLIRKTLLWHTAYTTHLTDDLDERLQAIIDQFSTVRESPLKLIFIS